jgi:hypothetical protein
MAKPSPKSIRPKVDISVLKRKLMELPGAMHRVVKPLMEQQAKLFVEDMVKWTPPAAKGVTGGAAKKAGENAVMRDISKIYASPAAVYDAIKEVDPVAADQFWLLYNERNYRAAASLMQIHAGRMFAQTESFSAFDGGLMHKRFRRAGKVRSRGVVQVVTDPPALRRYIAERKKRVGILAAGWLAVGKKFGARLPRWVERHPADSTGRVRVETSGGRFIIVMTSTVTYAEYQGQRRRAAWVLQRRTKALEKRLPHIIRAEMKKLGMS